MFDLDHDLHDVIIVFVSGPPVWAVSRVSSLLDLRVRIYNLSMAYQVLEVYIYTIYVVSNTDYIRYDVPFNNSNFPICLRQKLHGIKKVCFLAVSVKRGGGGKHVNCHINTAVIPLVAPVDRLQQQQQQEQ